MAAPCPASQAAIDVYLDEVWLERGLSENTLAAYRRDLRQLAAAVPQPLLEVTAEILADCLARRFQAGYQTRSSARWLSCVKGFYRHQVHKGRLAVDPSAELELPKLGRGLPGSLSEAEVAALLSAPDIDTPLGLRDRAMLELLYASGLRVSELTTLTVTALNRRQGVLRIVGKGGKERLVPVGQEALAWIERYVDGAGSAGLDRALRRPGAADAGPRSGHSGVVSQPPRPAHDQADVVAPDQTACTPGRHCA